MSVDLRHIDTWLFDLDNTLYPAESGFMGEIVVRMTDFVEKVTGLPREEAFKLQKTYLAEHGLTLKGMMLNHGLAHLFDDVFHIGSAGYEPKPSPEAFTRIGAAHGIDPTVTAFFEDAERNLAPAAHLGMTTVLVGAHAAASTATFVHHRTETLAPFLARAQLKEAA